MAEDRAANSSNKHDRDKNVSDDRVRLRHLGEIGITALFLVADFGFLWPENHFWALLLLAAGLGLLALMELPKPMRLDCVVLSFIGCGAAYWIIGPVVVPDREVTGVLVASRDSDPKICSDIGIPQPPGHFSAVIGDNELFSTAAEMPFIRMDDGAGTLCDEVSVVRSGKGIVVNGKIYEKTGKLVGSIADNVWIGIEGEKSHVAPVGDLSTLQVKDGDNKEIFWLRYASPNSIKIRGTFVCKDKVVTVTDDEIALPCGNWTVKFKHNCIDGYGLSSKPPSMVCGDPPR